MGHRQRVPAAVTALVTILLALSACVGSWEVEVVGPEGKTWRVDRRTLRELTLSDDEREVALDYVLYAAGYELINTVHLVGVKGDDVSVAWEEVAASAWWGLDGSLRLQERSFRVARIEVVPLTPPAPVTAHITDIAPTVAAALGLPAPAEATGRGLDVSPADHVVVLFLDGFGYLRYIEALEAGLIPVLAELDTPHLALTVYPPATSVASASLVTGAPPRIHGATHRGIRRTEVETVFDVVAKAGLRSVAVEGDALAFNLPQTEIILSGDRDGDGSTDDNVLGNARAVIEESMPDFLWIHFHGIDDAGHTYGPGAPEEAATIHRVDGYVGQILEALPEGTLVLIVADHGMHVVEGEGRLGNHGHLIARDMLIPIFVLQP
jgi:hypothetical protein